MTQLPEKLPVVIQLENDLARMADDMKQLLETIEAGQPMTAGKLTPVRFMELVERARVLTTSMHNSQAAQRAYENLLDAAQEALVKQSHASYAGLLLVRIEKLHKEAERTLSRIRDDDGQRRLDASRRAAAQAGVARDILERVQRDTKKRLDDLKQSIETEGEQTA